MQLSEKDPIWTWDQSLQNATPKLERLNLVTILKILQTKPTTKIQ